MQTARLLCGLRNTGFMVLKMSKKVYEEIAFVDLVCKIRILGGDKSGPIIATPKVCEHVWGQKCVRIDQVMVRRFVITTLHPSMKSCGVSIQMKPLQQ